MTIRTLSFALAAVCLTAVSVARAQEYRASITGQVADPSGAPVAGAKVVVKNVATNIESATVTSESGRYSVLYLTPGEYTATVEATGFKRLIRQGLDVRVGDALLLDLTLELGETQQSVTVTAQAAVLQTETASSGQVMDRRRISDLPLLDGNPFTLSRLAAGVVYTDRVTKTTDRPFDVGATSRINAAGATGYNEFTLDGTPNMGAGTSYTGTVAYIPPADAVEEFRIETASFDAQFGHTAGATVNVMLRSGTNQLHGTAYEFFRHDKLSANDFFLNSAGRPRDPLRYNRWGATAGGPIYVPRLYDGRNRTFFFFAYEGLKDRFPQVSQFTVPTEAERRGDFSALSRAGITIYDPRTAVRLPNGRIQRDPFPGNAIPANRLDAIGVNYLKFYPTPNQAGDVQGRNNYLSPRPTGDDFFSTMFRIDHNLTANQRAFFRYSHNYRTAFQENWSAVTNGIRATGNFLLRENDNAVFDHVWTLSPTSVLNWRAGFSRFSELRPRMSEGQFRPADLGFPAQTARHFGDIGYFPRFTLGAFSAIGDTIGPGIHYNILSGQPTLTKIAGGGRHNLRFGYDFRAYRENFFNPGHTAGRYDFGTDFTRGPLDSSAAAPIGQDLAALLLGLPTGGFIDRNASRANQTVYQGFFVQDDWKVSSRLTVNLGLRYDYEGAVTERYNRNVRGFDLTSASPIEAAARAAYAASPIPEVAAGDFRVRGGYLFADANNRGFWKADRNNFQPRAGMALKLGAQSVLRAGWGVFTVPFGIDGVNQDGFSLATNIVPTLDNGLTFVSSLANPFPNGVEEPFGSRLGLGTFIGRALNFPPAPSNPAALDRRNDQSQRWQISFQRELPGRWLIETAYVGNRGYDLTVNTDILDAVPARYLSARPERDQDAINFLTANVANPFRNLAPGTSLNGSVVQRQQLLRPFPQFLDIRSERQDGSSTYHSAQVKGEKRFGQGYTLLGYYQWSRVLDKRSFLNAQDTEYEERFGGADRTNRIVLSGIWELPFGRGRHWGSAWRGATNTVLGGWQVQGVYQLQSGSVLNFPNYIFRGNRDDVYLPASERSPERWFNTDAFEKNAARQLAMNLRTAPSQFPRVRDDRTNNWDLSVIKMIPIAESIQLQLRGEFLNALNRTQLGGVNLAPANSAFGRITAQGNMSRASQIAAKLVF